MKQLTRSELREKIMTILYQINVYTINKIEYNSEKSTKISDFKIENPLFYLKDF